MCFFSITINIIQNKVFPSRLSLSPHPGTTPLIVGTTEISWNFPVAQMVKNLPAKQDAGSVPGSGRSTGEGNGNLLQYSCLENPMHRGAWWATQSMGSQSHDWATNTHTLRLVTCDFAYRVKKKKKTSRRQNKGEKGPKDRWDKWKQKEEVNLSPEILVLQSTVQLNTVIKRWRLSDQITYMLPTWNPL